MNNNNKNTWPIGSVSSDTFETFEFGHRMIQHARYLLKQVIPDDVSKTDLLEAVNDAERDLESKHEDNLYYSTVVLIELFNELCPEDYYFGAHPNDGACFGYWKVEDEN